MKNILKNKVEHDGKILKEVNKNSENIKFLHVSFVDVKANIFYFKF